MVLFEQGMCSDKINCLKKEFEDKNYITLIVPEESTCVIQKVNYAHFNNIISCVTSSIDDRFQP
jgi:hypothetical protein